MKVLFLDIDGVLNSARYDRERTAKQGNIDETRLPLLKRIIEETGALIVLSSSWRKHWEREPALCDSVGEALDRLFFEYGLSVFDKTPVLPSNDRADEIRLWLTRKSPIERFVILDDIALGWGADLQEHLVRTNARIDRGLGEAHVLRAIEILNGTKSL